MAIDNNANVAPAITRQNPEMYGKTAADLQASPGDAYIGNRDAQDVNDDAIDTLSSLSETCRDGEYGFTECAEHTQTAEVKAVFLQRASDCRTAAAELQELIVQLGGKPDTGGSVSGAMHRGWVSIKGTLSGYSDADMLQECERGEDVALARYRKALEQNLPPNAQMVVERQAQGTKTNHDQIRSMRDMHTTHR